MTYFCRINTPSGRIQVVTSKEFVNLIPRKEWYSYSDKAGYYRRKSVPGTFYEYETVFKPLTKVSITNEEFVGNMSIESHAKDSLIQMVYDITTQSACEMGSPTHIVRLSRRLWMAANPEDFIIFFNHNGSALANLRPNKSIIWLVD